MEKKYKFLEKLISLIFFCFIIILSGCSTNPKAESTSNNESSVKNDLIIDEAVLVKEINENKLSTPVNDMTLTKNKFNSYMKKEQSCLYDEALIIANQPQAQIQFVETLKKARNQYFTLSYDSRRALNIDSKIKKDRDNDIYDLGIINQWVGYLSYSTSEGMIKGSIEVAPHVTLNFDRHKPLFSRAIDHKIPEESPLGKKILKLCNASLVIFSAEPGYYGRMEENSITTKGGIVRPEYMIELIDVKQFY